MPEIPVPDGCPPSFVAEVVLSYMLFPRDEVKRASWLASSLARHYSELEKGWTLNHDIEWMHRCICDLWELPLSPRRVFDDGVDRSLRASLAGRVLTYLLRLAHHQPGHCKVERAVAMAENFVRFRAGSESRIEKAWAGFKTVSPLWASWLLFMDDEAEEVGAPFEPKTFPVFLGAAEEFRKLSEKSRLLLPGEVWRVTAAERVSVVPIEINPIVGDELAFLRRSFPG